MMDDLDALRNCVPLLANRLRRTRGMIHPDMRALLAYWEALRAERDVPFRAEVDPRDMGCDVRNLFILEDLGAGNLRFRLAGSALTEAFGTELRGLSARTLMEGRARDSFTALIAESLAEPGVGYARLASARDPGEIWEVLLLPLRSDFGAVDRVLGSLVRVRAPEKARTPGPLDARLRFRIEEMSIRPVGAEESEAKPLSPAARPPAPTAPAVPGFAEVQTPFQGPGQPQRDGGRTRLKAIDGGRSEDTDTTGRPSKRKGDRPVLRIVRDD